MGREAVAAARTVRLYRQIAEYEQDRSDQGLFPIGDLTALGSGELAEKAARPLGITSVRDGAACFRRVTGKSLYSGSGHVVWLQGGYGSEAGADPAGHRCATWPIGTRSHPVDGSTTSHRAQNIQILGRGKPRTRGRNSGNGWCAREMWLELLPGERAESAGRFAL